MGDLGDLGPQPLRVGGGDPHPALIEDVGEGDGRPDGEPDHRQERIGHNEQHGGDGQHHHHSERHRQRGSDEGGRFDIGVDVGEKLSGRVTAMPLDGKLEIPIGHVRAVPLLEAVLRPVGPVAPDGDSQPAGHAHPEDRRCGPDQSGGGRLAPLGGRQQNRIRDPTDHERGHDRGDGIDECAEKALTELTAGTADLAPNQVHAPSEHLALGLARLVEDGIGGHVLSVGLPSHHAIQVHA